MVLIKDPLNIIICGVGGQGNILASELVGTAAVKAGYITTVGETYGASQRGGSVMSNVRLSHQMQFGPLIPRGEADVIVGFEPAEVLRVFRVYGNSGTRIIVNPRPNYPLHTLIGETEYPAVNAIIDELKRTAASVQIVEATEIARQVGQDVSQNVLMVGCLAGSGLMPVPLEKYHETMNEIFKGKALQINQNMFQLGIEAMI